MSVIGSMEVKTTDNGEVMARGRVDTINHSLVFLMSPDGPSQSEKAPTHKIEVKKGERYIRVGVAWMREMKRGENIGKKMFSLSLEDPDLPEWMGNIAAFPVGVGSEDGELYEIQHNRQRQQSQGEAA